LNELITKFQIKLETAKVDAPMPPVQEHQELAPPSIPKGTLQSKFFPLAIAALVLLAVVALLIYVWPRSDEALTTTFSCDGNLSWNITSGQSAIDTYGGQRNGGVCEYHRALLNKDGKTLFSIANFTACRDFKPEIDILNGINEPLYADHEAFPAGFPVIAAVGVPDAVVPTPNSVALANGSHSFGLEISNKSGLTVTDFNTAAKCLLNHRNEFQDVFGNMLWDAKLSWVALVDESAPYASGDLPGAGQVFMCKNGWTLRTSDEDIFALAPGSSPTKTDDTGMEMMNDQQIAVIGFDGTLYQPDRSNSAVAVSLPYADHKLVDPKSLPAPLSECTDSRGTSLAAFLTSLKSSDIVYQPPQENYVPKSSIANQSGASTKGIAPTLAQDADCKAKYAQSVTAAANAYVQDGKVSKGLFYSPSLSMCVGVVEVVNGNQQDFYTFNASTGQTLNADDNATAFQDWADDTSQASSTHQ
jgi:hypothetical protein